MKKGKIIYTILSWIVTAIILLCIFSLSAQNADDSKELSDSFVRKILEWLHLDIPGEVLRKFAHMLEFTALAACLGNAIYTTWKYRFSAVISLFVTVICAVGDEIHQIFVPGRAFQLSDILIDSIGAVIGITAYLILYKIYQIIKERGNKNGNSQTV